MNRLSTTSLNAGRIILRQFSRASSHNIHAFNSERGPPLCHISPETRWKLLHIQIQNISFTRSSCSDELIRNEIYRFRPDWKDRHDVKWRKVMLPGDEVDLVIKIFYRDYSKHIQSACCIAAGRGTNKPSAEPPHVLVVAPQKNITTVSDQVRIYIQRISNNVKKVYLPQNESMRFINRILARKHLKNCERQFDALLRLRGYDKAHLTTDIAHVAVAAKSERNVEEAALFINNLIQNISQSLIIRKVLLPKNERGIFIQRILRKKYLKNCEGQLEVLLEFGGEGTEDDTHVMVGAESERNVDDAALHMNNLIQSISQNLIIRKVPLPQNGRLKFIKRILSKKYMKNCEGQFEVSLEFGGQGTEDDAHVMIGAESERNVDDAALYMNNWIQSISQNLIIRKVLLPQSESLAFKMLPFMKNCEEQFQVLLGFEVEGTISPTDEIGYVEVAAESKRNVDDATLHINNLIQRITQSLIIRKVFLPQNDMLPLIGSILVHKYKKNCQEQFNVVFEVREWMYPSKDIPHVAVAVESKRNVDDVVHHINKLIEKITQSLIIRKVFLPQNESQEFIRFILLKKHLENCQAHFNVALCLRGKGMSFPTEDKAHVAVAAEYERNVQEAAYYMENLIHKISESLILRKLVLPQNKRFNNVQRLLPLTCRRYIEEEFNVLLQLRGPGTLNFTDHIPHVVVVAEPGGNIEGALKYIQNLID